MKAEELEKGMLVVAHVAGEVIGTAKSISVKRADGDVNFFRVTSDVSYDLLDPAGAPPELGDIWRDKDGIEYIAEIIYDNTLVLQPVDRGKHMPENVYAYADDRAYSKSLSDFYKLNPRLVRRREESDG